MTCLAALRLLAMIVLAVPGGTALAQSTDPRAAVQAAYVAGDFSRARSLLAPLIAVTPEDPDLLRRLALIEAAQGNLAAAQGAIDRAALRAPTDPDIVLARANILMWRGQIAGARREAAGVAAHHPGYPGLAELNSAIERAEAQRAFRLVSIDLGGTVARATFASGLGRTWSAQRASAVVGWGDDATATVEADREKRDVADTRVAARIDLPAGNGRVFASGTITPNADFRERWSVMAGGEVPVATGTTMLIDGRFAAYRAADIGVVGLGARFDLGRGVALTARSIHLLGGGESYRLGGSLRADYEPARGPALFAIVASYPDTEADGTRQLWSVAGGARFLMAEHLILGLAAEHESRRGSYRRTGVSLNLGWKFRP